MSPRVVNRAGPSRGFTLIELMVVVAIAGVLASLAAGAISSMLTSSRVRMAQRLVLSAVAGARLRSMASSCPHFVQVNGPTYAGIGPLRFPGTPRQVAVVRKGQCGSTNLFFEVGDVVLDSEYLYDDGAAQLMNFPVTVLTSGLMGNTAVAIGYDRSGLRSVRTDTNGDGTFEFDPTATLGTADLAVRVESPNHTYAGGLTIPSRGTPRLIP